MEDLASRLPAWCLNFNPPARERQRTCV